MSTPPLTQGTIWEDSGVTNLARIVGNSAVNVTQASLSSISYKVFDLNTSTTEAVASGPLTISSVIFDTLQTDARWTADSTGYNFRHEVAASVFATARHRYRIEYLFTPTTGQPFWAVFEIITGQIYTS